MNNSQEIILAQISAIYDKPPFVKVKTGQMEMILKCVGLGKYYDEYAKYLEPWRDKILGQLFAKLHICRRKFLLMDTLVLEWSDFCAAFD